MQVVKRDWDSITHDTGRKQDGKRVLATKIQNGLHDQEPDGSFVECDTTLETYEIGVSTHKVKRGRYKVLKFSDTASDSKHLAKIITKNDCGISLKFKDNKTYGPWQDTQKKIRYNTDIGVTLNHYPTYKGVNIEIVIDNPQTASNEYTFTIQPEGCTYTYEEIQGGIRCISSTGKDDIFIRVTYCLDVNESQGECGIRLGSVVDGYQEIIKWINPTWLSNAVGPVRFDPSVTINDTSTFFDAILPQNGPDMNYGGGTYFQVYAYTGGFYNTLLKADTTAYSGTTLVSGTARFGCDVYNIVGGTPIVTDYYQVLIDWLEGNSFGTRDGGCEWGYAKATSVPWTSNGCRGSGTDRNATADGTVNITGLDTDKQFPISDALAQAWLDDPSTNYGIVMETLSASKYWRGYSSESGASNLPYYYFEYVEAAGRTFFFFDIEHS